MVTNITIDLSYPKTFHPTRLEARTKESNMCASVIQQNVDTINQWSDERFMPLSRLNRKICAAMHCGKNQWLHTYVIQGKPLKVFGHTFEINFNLQGKVIRSDYLAPGFLHMQCKKILRFLRVLITLHYFKFRQG